MDWTAQSLERFAVVLSQTSIHTALQLCFIFIAAMEDNQPEKPDGNKNQDANIEKYYRCAGLLQNIQRAVIYGSPTLTAQEEELLSSQVSAMQMSELKDFEKNERADQIIRKNPTVTTSKTDMLQDNTKIFKGYLLYKRLVKKAMFTTKKWNSRFFKIEQKVLLCYKQESSKMPLRAISLETCDLFMVKREKYEYQFELVCKSSGEKYQLRAIDQTSFDTWVQALRRCLHVYSIMQKYYLVSLDLLIYIYEKVLSHKYTYEKYNQVCADISVYLYI